jgi:hypothetical protein
VTATPQSDQRTFTLGTLTPSQLDGLSCVLCGAGIAILDAPPSVPVGTVDGRQLFTCSPSCSAPEVGS